MATKGIVLFAKNNEEIDYIKLAKICALCIKKSMGDIPIALVCDQEEVKQSSDKHLSLFDQLIPQPKTIGQNRKTFWGNGEKKLLTYHNLSRPSVYELTPYEETLLIDSDFIVQNNSLNDVWGSGEDMLMNYQVRTISGEPFNLSDRRLSDFGPKMYWATVAYFRKSHYCQLFFDLVKAIRKNYLFYSKSYYLLSPDLYRNDYAWSIAAHLLSDTKRESIPPLPGEVMLSSLEQDRLVSMSTQQLNFLASLNNGENYLPVNVKGSNVHIMNKFDLLNNYPQFLDIYGG
ncbi:MAG: hypothetical protein HN730_01110 [Bdellovibrionales bacterium]|jgi:hypothetical protein|nr:hypothetical protein [Bdellovibrionales bacterium]